LENNSMKRRSGPLSEIKILEFAGIGPAPFCGMLLSDLGADVVRIDRKGGPDYDKFAVTTRGRRSIAIDLKKPAGVEAVLKLAEQAEGLIEGFRPGVMERLGLGPEAALRRNPRLVYGRMTGWGQTGPLARTAGHDINYIAITGALNAIGDDDRPAIPLNLIGDYGGGALYLAFGLLAGILHARNTGQGQVVDSAMSDGTISLLSIFYGNLAAGTWTTQRHANIIDGGSHFYNIYQCADDRWISLAAIEPQFYKLLLEQTGITDIAFRNQHEQAQWPELRAKLAEVIRGKTSAEWRVIMEGTDVCFAPVLDFNEATAHPQNQARGMYATVEGVMQPAPAPKFSETPGSIQGPPAAAGQHNIEALSDWGLSADEIERLQSAGAI
jgi:alpha-methylacyl-CoA racemase